MVVGTGDRVVVGAGAEVVGVGDDVAELVVSDVEVVSDGEVVPDVGEVVPEVGEVVSVDDVVVSDAPGVSGTSVPGSRLTTGTSGNVGSGAPGATVAAAS